MPETSAQDQRRLLGQAFARGEPAPGQAPYLEEFQRRLQRQRSASAAASAAAGLGLPLGASQALPGLPTTPDPYMPGLPPVQRQRSAGLGLPLGASQALPGSPTMPDPYMPGLSPLGTGQMQQPQLQSQLGALGQTQDQRALDAARAAQMQQRYEPFQRLSYMNDIFNPSIGSAGSTLGAATAPSPSRLAPGIGLGMAGLGANRALSNPFGSLFGTPATPPPLGTGQMQQPAIGTPGGPSPLGTGLQPTIGTPGGPMPSPQQQAAPLPFPNQFTGLGQGNIPSGGLGTFGNAFGNTLQWPFGPR